MFKEANLLEKGRFGWTASYELEQRLDILNHFKNKLLKDTGRDYIKSGNVHNEEAVAIEQLKTIAMDYFGTADPDEQRKIYEDFLNSEFGISLYPSAQEISGKWSSSSITITSYDLGEPPPESSAGTSSGEGCDLSDIDVYNMIKEGLDENIGKSNPISMSLDINSGGTGSMEITMDGDSSTGQATYNSG